MNYRELKRLGRLKAGSWGRPGSKWQKRQASKAVRRANKPVNSGE